MLFRSPGVDVRELMQVHRRKIVELMQQWTQLKEDESQSDLRLAMVIDAELFRLDAVIRWLDAAEGRINRLATEPLASASDTPRTRPKVGGRR